MFEGRKRAELEQVNVLLAEQNDLLRQRLAQITSDPYYAIGQAIKAETEEVLLCNPGMIDAEVTAIIDERRQTTYRGLVQEAAEQKTAYLIAAEKDKMTAEASVEADALAKTALQQFLEQGAEGYRTQLRQELTGRQSAAVIAEAKRQIAAEERARAVADAAERLAQQPDPVSEAEARKLTKQRAQELRRISRNTHCLDMGQLAIDDEITIGFVESGKGYEPLTDGYGGSYRSYIEKRRLAVRLVDTTEGAAEVVSDSWLNESRQRHQALRGGTTVFLTASEEDGEEPRPVLYKGRPVHLQGPETQTAADERLEVWWVNLGDFRAMS